MCARFLFLTVMFLPLIAMADESSYDNERPNNSQQQQYGQQYDQGAQYGYQDQQQYGPQGYGQAYGGYAGGGFASGGYPPPVYPGGCPGGPCGGYRPYPPPVLPPVCNRAPCGPPGGVPGGPVATPYNNINYRPGDNISGPCTYRRLAKDQGQLLLNGTQVLYAGTNDTIRKAFDYYAGMGVCVSQQPRPEHY